MTHQTDHSPTYHIRVRGRVAGPYDLTQLAKLRSRSKFGRANEVSRDGGRTWQSASTIEELFEFKKGSAVASGPLDDSVTPLANWYYVDSQGVEQGPLTEARLIELAQLKVIRPETSLYQTGDANWSIAADTRCLRRVLSGQYLYRMKKRPLLAITVALMSIVVIASLIFLSQDVFDHIRSTAPVNEQPSQENDPPTIIPKEPKVDASVATRKPRYSTFPLSRDPSMITSLEDESVIATAIGRVVCSERIVLPNQSVLEIPKAHGTAFPITSTGYFLTNRHVIQELTGSQEREIKLTAGSIHVTTEDVPYLFLGKLKFRAELVYTSSRFDMAILKIERQQTQCYFALSDKTELIRRTEVVALGFPGIASTPVGEESKMLDARFKSQIQEAMKSKTLVAVETLMSDSAFSYSAEDGRISRTNEDATKVTQIFHSAKIFPGNSGGPLLRKDAVVLGINTLILRDIGTVGDQVVTGDGIFIAFAINQMKAEIEENIPDPVVWVK